MTEQLSGPLAEWLADRIPKWAAGAHKRFRMVPSEDFEQEMWARALKRAPKLAKHFREGQEELIYTELRSAATKLGMEDDRSRRAAKASAAGYSSFDEQFYTPGVLARLITALAGAECKPELAMEQAVFGTDAAGIHIQIEDPFSGAENYMAMLVDVKEGLDRIKRGHRNILLQYYGLPVDDDTDEGRWERRKLASSMGITYEALRSRVHYAKEALQRELGGEDPWRKQDREAA